MAEIFQELGYISARVMPPALAGLLAIRKVIYSIFDADENHTAPLSLRIKK
jgi:hypothetical protein